HIALNLDGDLANRDRLYRNRCDGTFEDRSAALDPHGDPALYSAALASFAGHLDNDLWPDIYVANVAGQEGSSHQDRIYRNLGAGQFEEMTPALPGVGEDAQAAMGIDVGDVDLDGHWDVYIADIYATEFDAPPLGNVLYRGGPTPVPGSGVLMAFSDNEAPQWGVEGTDSWGVNFFDVDLDGDEDLFVATMASAEDELFFRNDGDGFAEISKVAGILTGNSRGSAVADYDRDGDLDLAVINQGSGGLQIFRNDTVGAGHWLALELRGVASSTEGIGAVVELDVGTVTQRRQVKGGSSAHSQDDLVVFFGVGDAAMVDEVRVYWASGSVQRLVGLEVNRRLEVVEDALMVDGFEAGDLKRWSAAAGVAAPE
ncbi:MAG: CRTAC1 family protein, partial [Acidobacteriota bacterium]